MMIIVAIVVMVVLKERDIDCVVLMFTRSFISATGISFLFSLIRSYTTIVLFIEHPRIVRTTAMKFELIWNPMITKNPYVTITSWIRAITAHIPEDQPLILLKRKAI